MTLYTLRRSDETIHIVVMVSLAVAPPDDLAFEAVPGARRDWDRLIGPIGQSSLEQSWTYGEAVAASQGAAVTRLIIRNGDRPVALVQGFALATLNSPASIAFCAGRFGWMTFQTRNAWRPAG